MNISARWICGPQYSTNPLMHLEAMEGKQETIDTVRRIVPFVVPNCSMAHSVTEVPTITGSSAKLESTFTEDRRREHNEERLKKGLIGLTLVRYAKQLRKRQPQ